VKAQYANGGWPQYFPLNQGYYTHITYNDDAMAGVLGLLREVSEGRAALRTRSVSRAASGRQTRWRAASLASGARK